MTNIFKRIDDLKLYEADRKDGLTPFALLDGHGSRFDVQFLEYINELSHKWNMCLGVPYGTALWQVADSSEQHGRFKMNLNKAKRELYNLRIDSCMQDMHLMRTDIVPLVAKCWGPLFCDVAANKRAIARRGWGPYNRNLLLHSTIFASMTEEMVLNERNMHIFPHKHCANLLSIDYTDLGNGKVRMSHIQDNNGSISAINLNGGVTSQHVVSTIVTDYVGQIACEHSQKLKEEGKTVHQRLASIKKCLTFTSLTITGRHYHMDGNVLNHTLQLKDDVFEKEQTARCRKDLEYAIKVHRSNQALRRNPSPNVKEWRNCDEIKTYLQPLKLDEDAAWPTKRKGFENLFVEWRSRGRFHLVYDEYVMKEFKEWIGDVVNSDKGNRKSK